jgi:metal-dependent amidase/aminoacylase/carboxypeptidase family protein
LVEGTEAIEARLEVRRFLLRSLESLTEAAEAETEAVAEATEAEAEAVTDAEVVTEAVVENEAARIEAEVEKEAREMEPASASLSCSSALSRVPLAGSSHSANRFSIGPTATIPVDSGWCECECAWDSDSDCDRDGVADDASAGAFR